MPTILNVGRIIFNMHNYCLNRKSDKLGKDHWRDLPKINISFALMFQVNNQ